MKMLIQRATRSMGYLEKIDNATATIRAIVIDVPVGCLGQFCVELVQPNGEGQNHVTPMSRTTIAVLVSFKICRE